MVLWMSRHVRGRITMCVLLRYCGQRGCVDVVVLNLRGLDGCVVDKGHMWMLLPAKSKGVGEVDVEAAVMGDVDRRAGVEVGRQVVLSGVIQEFRRKFNASLSAPFVVLIAPVTQNELVATHIRLPAITFNAFVKLQRHAPPVQISPNYPDPTPSAPTTTATMPASVLSTVPPTSTLQFPPVPSSVSRAPMTSVSLTKSTLLGQKNKDVQLMCVIFVLKLGKGVRENILFQQMELPAVGRESEVVHWTLLYGGIYVYPHDAKSKKLRLLYEYAPMRFIVEQAGGKGSYGHQIVLISNWPSSLYPKFGCHQTHFLWCTLQIHPKVALYIGSKEEMEKLDDVFERFMSFSFVDSKIA
ncbi:hypothetical protein Bca4012_030415 [Brassica carinata]|uniref:D-fructose-1,6-bisphosphate 1-phosphohydrolase n=1 Tax=Brassica carinata TaxID=52824 RepID=A0A8X7RIV6_BRACI|nr:hypothetical protein Bca52824_048291 [Brassica carinata]